MYCAVRDEEMNNDFPNVRDALRFSFSKLIDHLYVMEFLIVNMLLMNNAERLIQCSLVLLMNILVQSLIDVFHINGDVMEEMIVMIFMHPMN